MMARLDVRTALERAIGFGQAVVSFVDADGYPQAVAGDFTVATDRRVTVGPLHHDVTPPEGAEVCVTFSHIRPRPGYGYDEHRYVNLWGRATRDADGVTILCERATGWDEEETPFFEYSERSVPRGRRYLTELGRRARLGAGWTFFLATRLPFLTATIVPVALGAAIAASHGSFSWGLFGLTMLGACCIHLGLNVANDIFDDLSGADAANVTPTHPLLGRFTGHPVRARQPWRDGRVVCSAVRGRHRDRAVAGGHAGMVASRHRGRRCVHLPRLHGAAPAPGAPGLG
jgi:hypothetical protein